MQVSTLSAQLGLGPELVDWYRDATSVLYDHLLIDLSPHRDDRLHYCTNTGSIPSKFYIPERPKQSKILDDEHKNLSTLQMFQSFCHICKSLFLQSCPKEFVRFFLRKNNKCTQGKPAKHKKTSRGKISKRGLTIVSKTYNLEARKRHSGVRKRLTAH